ncbi:MAG: SRPBCC domain-containing protein [Chloroflexi bacterium]|nr:SRPBCC domain-containing protein [Chloroflexota bacterium]MDA1002118.1 SRPBCC domain-containing protein [Chloroflexota bacterium]
MCAAIGAFVVRRSIWINASPDDVWHEFESLERMQAWYRTGHVLVAYDPRVGGCVEINAGEANGEPLRFAGLVTHFEPERELSFEQDWLGRGWAAPPIVTLRLAPVLGGTLVELLHHSLERTADVATAADACADSRRAGPCVSWKRCPRPS